MKYGGCRNKISQKAVHTLLTRVLISDQQGGGRHRAGGDIMDSGLRSRTHHQVAGFRYR